MKVIYNSNYNSNGNASFKEPKGIGLGNFDGLHIGHMVLVNTLIAESRLFGLKSMIYTFTKHPENILRKKLFTPLLTAEGKKIELLRETSLDYLFFEEFDESFSRIKPESFVKDILVDKLNIKIAIAGFDYRFGYRGQGNTNILQKLGKLYGFKVIVIPPVKLENEIVSSTIIRDYVAKGRMDKAFRLLGRHYSITGEVKDGKRLGSKLGFPTANIHPEDYLILPRNGVYITKTLIDGSLFDSVTNIGKNPTFIENSRTSVETHILNFDRDIYNKKIEVFFIARIRGEIKFRDKNELIEQVNKDIAAAREFFRA